MAALPAQTRVMVGIQAVHVSSALSAPAPFTARLSVLWSSGAQNGALSTDASSPTILPSPRHDVQLTETSSALGNTLWS